MVHSDLPSQEPEIIPSFHSFTGKKTVLIDRIEEMKILKKAADRAILGKGSLVLLHGEAGIGKTRLARELLSYARAKKMWILHASCPAPFEGNGAPPYILWKDVIRDYLRDCTPNQLKMTVGYYPAEICKLVPETKQKLKAFSESVAISPELEKDRLIEAVSHFITNISATAPLVIVLDNLQWADSSSFLLLQYLARGIYRESILLLGAYRDTEVVGTHNLLSVLTELNRERLSHSIKLKRLHLVEITQLIKQIFGQDHVSKEFCGLVYKKTNGNPFFVEEVLKSLKEDEIIYYEKNEYTVKQVSKINFPRTVKSVFESKLNRLDEESLRLLTIASCIGNDFSLETLIEISGIDKNKLLEILEKMLKTRLFKSKTIRGEVKCSFSDTIVRDILYEEISPFKRKYLHETVGKALEKVYAKKIDEYYGELALHFLKGGNENKARNYFLKAGKAAAKIYANNEAEFYFQSALELLEGKTGVFLERAEIIETLGDIKEFIGEHNSSVTYWNEALALWKQLEKKERVANIHQKIAHIFWNKIGNVKKAEDHQEKAMRILVNKPENTEIASLNADMAQMYFRVGDMKKAFPLVKKALEIAERINAYQVIASSNLTLGALYNLQGDHRNAILCFEKALKVSLDNNCMETAVHAYDNLGWALRETEEKERRLECYRKGYDLAKRVGAISALSWIGNNLSDLYISMGETNQALPLKEESVALDRKTGNLINLTLSLGGLGYVSAILGEWNTCEKYLNEALIISKKLNDFPAIGLTYKALGMYYINKEEFEKAKKFAEKAYVLSKKAGSKIHQAISGYYSTLCSIEIGELARAEDQIDRLYKLAQQLRDKERLAYVIGLKAMLLRSKKKWKESIKYFEKSFQQLEALNVRVWDVYEFAKRILLEYARVYMERNQEGDMEKAHILLEQALEIFKRMGAKKDIAIVEARMFGLEISQGIQEPKPISNVATGCSILDRMLYGGIPPTFSVTLSSPPCDQKDLLIKTFLETGVKEGQITFHITAEVEGLENLAKKFQSNYFLFLCNPRANSLVSALPNIYKLGGQTDLTNLSIALSKAYRSIDQSLKGPRRACVEIVSDVLLHSEAKVTRRWLEDLLHNLKLNGFTTLAAVDPLMHTPDQLHAILGLFDGEISIREKETAKGTDRLLKIKRMRNQKYIKKEVHLTKDM